MNKTATGIMLAMGLLAWTGGAGCRRAADDAEAATQAAAQEAEARRQAAEERLAWFGAEAGKAEVTWLGNGLGHRIAAEGTGAKPGIGSVVRLTYTGRLKDGTVFDRTEKPVEFQIGRTIPGLSTGLQMLGTGGRATFYVPPQQGYGGRKVMGIPPNSGLIFDVEVVAVNP